MATTRTVATATMETAVTEAGEGGRPLLLVHGFTGAGSDFDDHLDDLGAAGWHVVAPDLRGHGTSGSPAGGTWSFPVFAGDVLALADSLGWTRFALLGHSMGGMVAQVAALVAPERLVALVLMDTSPGPVRIDRDLAALGCALVAEHGTAGLAEFFAGQPGESPLETPAARRLRLERPELGAVGDANLRAASPEMYVAMVSAMLDAEDRLAALAAIPVPTLVVVGEQDGPFLAASQAMAATIPGARLEIIADAGHSPQREAPEAWAKVVTTFLEDQWTS